MNPLLLPKQETGLLGSIRSTGIGDMGRVSFNDDGSRKSFADTKATLKDVADMGRIASLAGAATANKDLSGLGSGVSQLAGIASDPERGLLGTVLGRVAPGVPAAMAMGAFDANRNDRDMVDSVAVSGLNALTSKMLFGAAPALGLANAVSSLFGGPTVGTAVRDAYNYVADSVEGIDPATSIRTVNADLDDAGWRAPKAPTDADVDAPTDAEKDAAPDTQDAPDDGGSFGLNEGGRTGWGGEFGGGLGNNGQGATSDNGGDD